MGKDVRKKKGGFLDNLSARGMNLILGGSVALVAIVVFVSVFAQMGGKKMLAQNVLSDSNPPAVSQTEPKDDGTVSVSDADKAGAAVTDADGNYILMNGAAASPMRLNVAGQNETGFDFSFTFGESSLKGKAKFTSGDEAIFNEESGETISFIFADDGILVDYSIPGAPAVLSGAESITGLYSKEKTGDNPVSPADGATVEG